MKLILSLPSPSPSPSSPPFVQHNIFNVISRCRPVNRRTKDGAGESGRSLKEGARGGGEGAALPPPQPPSVGKRSSKEFENTLSTGLKFAFRPWITSRYDFLDTILDCFTDAIKLFVTMKWRARAPTLGWNLRGRRSGRGAEWQKLDIQKVSRKVNLISVRRARS